MTNVVGKECLLLLQRFKGGLLGASHSWVADQASSEADNQMQLQSPRSVVGSAEEAKAQAPNTGVRTSPLAQAALHNKILHLVAVYVPDVDVNRPLVEQGLDSLASLELRQKVNESLGVELAILIEDPQGATVAAIVAEAVSKLGSANGETAENTHSVPQSQNAVQQSKHQAWQASQFKDMDGNEVHTSSWQPTNRRVPPWISPAPISVKMRLFCIPYAGGVSENVFAR